MIDCHRASADSLESDGPCAIEIAEKHIAEVYNGFVISCQFVESFMR